MDNSPKGLVTNYGEGGGGGSLEAVLTRELEFLAILMRGCKKFPPFKRGGGRENLNPVWKWGGGGGEEGNMF